MPHSRCRFIAHLIYTNKLIIMKIRSHPRLETLTACDSNESFDSAADLATPLPTSSLSPSLSSSSSCSDAAHRESTFGYSNAKMTERNVAEATDKRYTVERMSSADSEEVIVFLRTFFFKDEPLNRSLGLGDCPELEQWSVKYLKENRSFKAINSQGEIIGVIINGLVDKHVEDEVPDDVCKHQQFNAILEMMQYVGTQFNLFDRFPQFERALDGKIMSVNNAYRGVGICKELTRRTIEYMLEQDVHLFHVMCTSHYSGLVCEHLGMSEIFTLHYTDYVVDGRHPLQPAEPHTACRLYAKIV